MDRDDAGSAPGLDGLTAAELIASRQGWWDEAFTSLLVRRAPAGAATLVDVGCGVATAAHALLPRLPQARYVGVDADEERLRQARQLVEGTAYADRVDLRPGRAEHLPCADAEAALVLSSMTLQHLADPRAAIVEIARVLAPGGSFVAVEPDNTNNLLYFDGPLAEVTAALRALFEERRRHLRPADLAVGPAVARLVEQERLEVVEFFPYALGRARKLTAADFFQRARQGVDRAAAALPPGTPAVQACSEALARAESEIGRAVAGYGCQLTPVFVCVARKA